MGVQGLWKLLESTGRPVNPETLEGKILAVDISIWLNQAVKGARDRQGNAIQNAHLLTLFHRLCKLLFFRIRPIFVFDGEAPGLKRRTLAARRQRKTAAVEDSTKTTDKLLKTFLKRQAIKAVLTGKTEEVMPSLSQVRRDEVDDIYHLPALEEKEKNSSDEEDEKEWEERMTQKQLLQEEFLQDPHAVDIESEDFTSLPPEVKHEILTDLKELTKRRRTIFETMPEESNDFSQYQLKGLLKKNTLNRRIETVQKEMNEECSGDIQALYENEGGFLKNVENKKLMSEDTSRYVLIKGLKSKKEAEQEDLHMSSSAKVMPPELTKIIPAAPAAAHPLSPIKPEPDDRTTSVAPPSPRTMLAIQEAMMESSSDEESVEEDKTLPVVQHKNVPVYLDSSQSSNVNAEGNMSPRTILAIQQALNEDIDERGDHENPYVVNTSAIEHIVDPRARVLLISSSDDEKDVVPEIMPLKKPILLLHITDLSCSQTVGLVQKKADLETNTMISTDRDIATIPDDSPLTPKAAEKEAVENKHECSNETGQQTLPERGLTKGVTDREGTGTAPVFPVKVDSLGFRGLTATVCNQVTEDNCLPQSVLQPKRGMSLSSNNIPALPDIGTNVKKVNDQAIQSIDSDSDSNDGFIEVESHLSDPPLVEPEPLKTFLPETETILTPLIEESPRMDQSVSGGEMENTMGDQDRERLLPAQHENEAAESREEAVNEWHDISLEELETLEGNLLVQQGTLQAQKQQQERIAATVTGQMYLESQELLRLFGVPFIVAPTEAEAQCAILDLTDQTAGTITDDSDIWLFGARHVYKNFFSQNKYVEYYQYVDIHTQLGLDRNKLINLAYLLGSDYTDGIPTVGGVTAMEIMNEFAGHGLQPLIDFRDWWAEAQKNKKIRANPNDTKVKKKLRELELHPGFPNLAVAEAYLKPVVDDSQGAFSWGRPDLEQIREFCATAFGWYRSKTDDILLPVLKQLNNQQTQLRIDSFFRIEQHEKQAIKSQRLRRAVICMQRKEKEGYIVESEESSSAMDQRITSPGKKTAKQTVQDSSTGQKRVTGKRKKVSNSQPDTLAGQGGGFLGVGRMVVPENGASTGKSECEATNIKRKPTLEVNKTSNKRQKNVTKDKIKVTSERAVRSSSEEDESEENIIMVTAKSVFENKVGKLRSIRGRRKKK